ncbi:copper homeostasis protein CutC [Roseateles sp. NT4]|uniref:copper homeostasis protein CutC n=1 Tax=Roseateles sp. NT4 TaxID=3453715 RepID=UPI003EEFFB5D
MRLLEVCVDGAAGLEAAMQGGADRIELCSSLATGGVTASAGLMALASRLPIPVIALIRPRSGDFVYSNAEELAMLRDIETAAELGLAGIAIGAMTGEGRLDLPMLGRLGRRAQGLQLTLHRAFDLVQDQATALEEAVTLGFHRILTSGGALSATAGAAQLASLVEQSRERIAILAGGGITPRNVRALLQSTQVSEVHASCRSAAVEPAPDLMAFGFAESPARITSAALIQELKASIQRA